MNEDSVSLPRDHMRHCHVFLMDQFSLRDAFQICCHHRYRCHGRGSKGQNLVIREALNGTVTREALKKFAERSTSSCRKRANGEAGFQHSASGTSQLFGGVHSSNIYQEIFMKSIARAILVGSLIVATQAALAAGSAIPEGAFDGEYGIPAQSTYADIHASDPVTSVGSAIPEQADQYNEPPVQNTYADRHASDPVTSVGSAIPEQADQYREPSAQSTYADTHL